jgi:hypothetical protein
MEEPSKPSPSRNTSSPSALAGIEKCCHVPGRSQNLMSTTWSLRSRTRSSTRWTSSALSALRVNVVVLTLVAMYASLGW